VGGGGGTDLKKIPEKVIGGGGAVGEGEGEGGSVGEGEECVLVLV